MSWTTTADPNAFLDAAGAFLRADPAANSVILTGVETLRERPGGDALLGFRLRAGEAVSGVFLHTPPYPPALTAMSAAAAAELADTLAALERPVPGANGDARAVEAFAAAWAERTGAVACVHRRMRLHRLDALVPPCPMPSGEAVVAGPEHRDLVVAWYDAFAAEIDEPPADFRPHVEDRIADRGVTLWLDGGEPVSLAGRTRIVAATARVAPVYTPPELRGRSYAAAATAAVTQAALDDGADQLLLYTDLANPTSNRLYARLGYRPLEDTVSLVFDGGG